MMPDLIKTLSIEMGKYSKGKFKKTLAMDEATSEIVGRIIPYEYEYLKKETGFYMGDQSFTSKLAKDKELRGQPLSVLLYILSILKNGNSFNISQKKIANELDIDPVRVSLAIKKLVEKEIIDKDTESGVRGCYLLNPEYFWNGEREKSLKNYRKNKQK
jgi:hypothetical protein